MIYLIKQKLYEFKKLKLIFLILFILLLQVCLANFKTSQLNGDLATITTEELEGLRFLSSNNLLDKTETIYKLVDYDNINAEQAHSIREYKEKGGIYLITQEREEVFNKTYKELSDTEKIAINYLLFVENKEPVETIENLNIRLEPYQEYFKLNLITSTNGFLYVAITGIVVFIAVLMLIATPIFDNVRKESEIIFVCTTLQIVAIMFFPVYNFYLLPLTFFIINFIVSI